MSKNNSLDLSSLSMTSLLNDDAGVPAPQEETAASDAEATEESAAKPEVANTEPVTEEPETGDGTDEVLEPTDDVVNDIVDNDEQTLTVIDVLREKFGYEIQGEYDEDYDGVVEFTKAVADEIAKEQVDAMFNQYPDVQEYLSYRHNGGKPEDYFRAQSPEVDFTQIEIDPDNSIMQRQVVERMMQIQGYAQEEIAEYIQDYVDAGILEKQARRSLVKLQEQQASEKVQLVEKQKQQAQQERERVQQQWSNIKSTIDKGTVRGFNIPEADKNNFFKWMAEPASKDGKTQRLIDRESLDLESQVAMEYLIWKKFDLNKLVTARANSKKASSMREKLQQTNTSAARRMKGSPTTRSTPNLPSLGDIFGS